MRKYLPHEEIIEDLKERFWKKVEDVSFFTDEDCWLWIGGTDTNGYGQIHFRREMRMAHRISWWIYKDYCQSNLLDTPEICVLHKCDSPLCINPNHLFLGTRADNNKDKMEKGRATNGLIIEKKGKLFCIYGHEFTLENIKVGNDRKRRCLKCMKKRSKEYRLMKLMSNI